MDVVGVGRRRNSKFNYVDQKKKHPPGILKAKSDTSTISYSLLLTDQYLLGLFIKTGISREEMLHEIVDSFEFGDI